MGDFFDKFDKIEVDWDKITLDKIEGLLKKLSEQDAERIFGQMMEVIESNNKKKTMVKWSFIILELAMKHGLKLI